MSNCKGSALYPLNSVWPIFHLSCSFKRKMMLCLLLIRKEDNKCIILFNFFPARLSTYSGLLSRSDKGMKQIHFLNKRICGVEMSSNYLDFTDLCKWTGDENNLINSTNDFMGYNQGWFGIFLFLPNHCLHYLAFSEYKEKPFEKLWFSCSLQNQANFCIQGLRQNSLWLQAFKRRQPAL